METPPGHNAPAAPPLLQVDGVTLAFGGVRALTDVSFAVNQGAYALALHWLPWRYDILLAGVLLAVAAGTYLLGKLWAFRSTQH